MDEQYVDQYGTTTHWIAGRVHGGAENIEHGIAIWAIDTAHQIAKDAVQVAPLDTTNTRPFAFVGNVVELLLNGIKNRDQTSIE